jgi:hypothetical protein
LRVIAVIGIIGKKQPRDGETNRGREEDMMGNESKDHRKDANMYSIDCRTRDESGGFSDLERGRSRKAEETIRSENDLV